MDAFGASHRKHSSTFTISKFAPITCGGLLLIMKYLILKKFLQPKKTLLAVIGGSKVSTKLNVLKRLITKLMQ